VSLIYIFSVIIINYYLIHLIMESDTKTHLTFVTGNKKKLEEFMSIMDGTDLAKHYSVSNMEINLDEL
jgi:hypothetical protein